MMEQDWEETAREAGFDQEQISLVARWLAGELEAKRRARKAKRKAKRLTRRLPPKVVFRTLTINFETKTIVLDGRRIQVSTQAITIPILGTEHLIVPRDGSEIL